MRNPSIHITRTNLSTILTEIGVDVKIIPVLMAKAQKFSIRNRVFVHTKSKGRKKVDSLIESDTNLLERFNAIYQGCLIAHSIKAMTVGKISPQYKTLREICHQAKEFSDLNSLEYEEGFKIYVETGIKLLGNKFGIYRLKGTALKIMEYHQAKTLIESDPDPKGTDEIIFAWATAVKTYFKTSIELENDAQRVHFIHAREDADSLKADYYDYIYAQFEKYSYLNSIPAFTQLYGDQARLNYQTYMAKVKKENPTTEEQLYFNKVKNEKAIPIKATQQEARTREARLHSSS
jgi:hypothetical protein